MTEEIKHDVPLGIGPKYVRTKITKDGKVEVEAFGFEDGACHVATHELEQRLGSVESSEDKDDGRESHQTIS